MQPVMAGAAVACLGGRGVARLCGIPSATGRSKLTPTGEAQAAATSPLSRMESAVCAEPPTLQPAPTVSFTFHLEHCCHALFYLLANLNIAMSAVPGASWMPGHRQMLMPVWIDEVFCKSLCLSEKLFPKCYCKDSGDECNDEKDDPIFTKLHFF